MLHLLHDETVARIFKKAPKIRRAYFNQTQGLVHIILETLRQASFEDIYNYRAKLNRLMTDFAESLDTLWVPDGNSQPGDAYASITRLKNITIEFSALTQNRLYPADVIEKTLREALDKDAASALRLKELLKKLFVKNEEAKERLKTFPKRQTEIAFYPKLLDSPEFHPIGSIASSLTLNHILFLLVENKLVRISENAHFYHKIPGEETKAVIKPQDFTKCIADIQKGTGHDRHVQLHVLCDRQSAIFFQFGKSRVFGNIWEVGKEKNEWLLKDVRGDLIPSQLLKTTYEPDNHVVFETMASGSEGKEKKTLDLTVALQEAKSAKFDVSIRPLAPVVSPSRSNASSNSFFTADEDDSAIAADSETITGIASAIPSDQPPQSLSGLPTLSVPGNRVISSHVTVDPSTATSLCSPAILAELVVNGTLPALDLVALPSLERATPYIPPQLVKTQKTGAQSSTYSPAVPGHAQSEYGSALIYQNTHGKSPIPGTSRPSGLQPESVSGIAVATMTTAESHMPTYHSSGPIMAQMIMEAKEKKRGFFSRIVKATKAAVRTVVGRIN